MFKTIAAALVAASVIAAPVLAQGTASKSATKPVTPATEMTKAPEGKAAVKTVKAKHMANKHVTKHVAKKPVAVKQAKHRKHIKIVKANEAVKHVRHARHGHHYVKSVSAKPAVGVKTTGSVSKPSTTGSAPKTSAN
jgi:hypothetical protein